MTSPLGGKVGVQKLSGHRFIPQPQELMQEPGGLWGEARLGLSEAPAEDKSPQTFPLFHHKHLLQWGSCQAG